MAPTLPPASPRRGQAQAAPPRWGSKTPYNTGTLALRGPPPPGGDPSGHAAGEDPPQAPARSAPPRAFVSAQQFLPSSQLKASWASDVYSAPKLAHAGLEQGLAQRVLAKQPESTVKAHGEIVIRDMANSVVREIVGIVESLLDRLLLERKQDTIRNMVAELITEDIANTIATAHEQLKQQEIGHFISEMKSLRHEIRETQAIWEERFQVTDELRDQCKTIRADMSETNASVHARLGALERDIVAREEVERRFKASADDVGDVRQHAAKVEEHSRQNQADLEKLRSDCSETYATKSGLLDYDQKLHVELDGVIRVLTQNTQDVKAYAAANQDNAEKVRMAHEEHLRSLQSDAVKLKSEANVLNMQFVTSQQFNSLNYATKAEEQRDISRLSEERSSLESLLKEKMRQLEVRDSRYALLDSIRKALTSSSQDLDKTNTALRTLEERCDVTLAMLAMRGVVMSDPDEREELVKLRGEFEEERAHLRKAVEAQYRQNNKDWDDAAEACAGIREEARAAPSDSGHVPKAGWGDRPAGGAMIKEFAKGAVSQVV